jgi:hypothetical protein
VTELWLFLLGLRIDYQAIPKRLQSDSKWLQKVLDRERVDSAAIYRDSSIWLDRNTDSIRLRLLFLFSQVTPLASAVVDNEGGRVVDSTGALVLKTIPKTMVVIGGNLSAIWLLLRM